MTVITKVIKYIMMTIITIIISMIWNVCLFLKKIEVKCSHVKVI